jgi:hypothetical protein
MTIPKILEPHGWTQETWDESAHKRLYEGYLAMATKAKYRPGAPSDGFGHIVGLTKDQLKDQTRLEQEALEYAFQFRKEEDGCAFRIGCSDFRTNRAFMWTIEAARLLAGGGAGNSYAIKLLEMAAAEIKQVDRGT